MILLPTLLVGSSAILALACLHAALLVTRWRRSAPTAAAMTLLLATEALWAGAYAAELVAPDLDAKLRWDAIQSLPAILVPFTTLGLVWVQRGGERAFARLWIGAGALVGGTLAVLRLTEPQPGLTRLGPHLDPGPGLPVLDYGLTFGEKVMHSAAMACVFAALILLAQGAFRERGGTRRQLIELLVGLAPAAVFGVLEIWRVRVFTIGDTTPLWFGAAHLVSAWASFPRRLLDLGPIARQVLVEQLPDPVLVLDRWGRIVELNPAAERWLGAAVGREIGGVVPELERALSAPGGDGLELQRGARSFEGRWVPLSNRAGERRGVLVALRDVTSLRGADQRLFELQQQLGRRSGDRKTELDASEARLRAFFERSIPALLVDREGYVLEANRAARQTIGFDDDRPLGMPLHEALAGDHDRASRTRGASQSRRSGGLDAGDDEQAKLEGQLQQALARARRGEAVRVEVNLPDVTEPQTLELTIAALLHGTGSEGGVLLVELRELADSRGSRPDRSRWSAAR